MDKGTGNRVFAYIKDELGADADADADANLPDKLQTFEISATTALRLHT
jgi:hypothetical protein